MGKLRKVLGGGNRVGSENGSDAVSWLASGFDNSILRIQTAYSALGDPFTITCASLNRVGSGSERA